MVAAMSKVDRAKKLEAFENWADTVDSDGMLVVDTTALRALMELSEQRSAVDLQLVEAVRQARADHHSWSEIGVMLGVSKQAAQRKYGPLVAA